MEHRDAPSEDDDRRQARDEGPRDPELEAEDEGTDADEGGEGDHVDHDDD